MKNWIEGGIIAAINAAAEAGLVYLSLYVAAPEVLQNPNVWKGLGAFIAFNVLKAVFLYFRVPPTKG